jgi:hypothetical protein
LLAFACGCLSAQGRILNESVYPPRDFTGQWVAWYTNGQKKCECRYVEGNPDGKWVYWCDNGVKTTEIDYDKGILHGHHTTWHRNGKRASQATFDKGKLVKQVPIPGDDTSKEWGIERAKEDLAKGIRRIYYFGPPWGYGLPPKDKESGLPVEIVAGCMVSSGFPEKIQGYNETMRTAVKGDPQPIVGGDAKSAPH